MLVDKERDEKAKALNLAFPRYSHDSTFMNEKREKNQPGPCSYTTMRNMGKYSSEGNDSKKLKKDDKEKKSKRPQENFPGPGSYNLPGEFTLKEPKEEKKKKDEKIKNFPENANYLSDTVYYSSLAPGPGNYSPIDNIIWNRMSKEGDKKQGILKKNIEDKKDKDKRLDKPTPGPGSYDLSKQCTFPEMNPKGERKMDKKDKDDKGKGKKDDDSRLFGQKLTKVPGPGTYEIKRDMMSAHSKLTQGRFNTSLGSIRRDIVRGIIGV